MKGVVYCVTSKLINFVKIGFWTGNLKTLRSRYCTSYGSDVEILYVTTNNAHILETKCHERFEKYRISNELFNKEHISEYIGFLKENEEEHLTNMQKKIINTENNDIDVEKIYGNLNNNIISYGGKNIKIVIDDNNKTWFCAKDTAKMLNYSDKKEAILRHVIKTEKTQFRDIILTQKIKQHSQTLYISEDGLYSLIFGSRMKTSKSIQNWIKNVIIPTIAAYLIHKKNYWQNQHEFIKKERRLLNKKMTITSESHK
jgi:prophage antirepressor-like protein